MALRDVKGESTASNVLRWFQPGAKELCTSFQYRGCAQIHPNPADNFITISSDKEVVSAIRICNSLGQEVIKMENKSSVSTSIDVSKLQSGIYFLEVKHGERSTKTKFLKN
ncbi:MAG: T9SS type A sorting domain-containing protein [Flavobacterium sp.]|nr:T9SS type A sorting domain-containing protein [Flavobacterium sp.]